MSARLSWRLLDRQFLSGSCTSRTAPQIGTGSCPLFKVDAVQATLRRWFRLENLGRDCRKYRLKVQPPRKHCALAAANSQPGRPGSVTMSSMHADRVPMPARLRLLMGLIACITLPRLVVAQPDLAPAIVSVGSSVPGPPHRWQPPTVRPVTLRLPSVENSTQRVAPPRAFSAALQNERLPASSVEAATEDKVDAPVEAPEPAARRGTN